MNETPFDIKEASFVTNEALAGRKETLIDVNKTSFATEKVSAVINKASLRSPEALLETKDASFGLTETSFDTADVLTGNKIILQVSAE